MGTFQHYRLNSAMTPNLGDVLTLFDRMHTEEPGSVSHDVALTQFSDAAAEMRDFERVVFDCYRKKYLRSLPAAPVL